MKTHYRFLVRWVPTDITLDDDCPTEEISSGGNKNVEKKKVKMDDCFFFFSKQQPHSNVGEFSLKKQRERGALILQLRLFWLPSKVKGSFGVNEIKKTAPNCKQSGFTGRSVPFLNCGEKLFSS